MNTNTTLRRRLRRRAKRTLALTFALLLAAGAAGAALLRDPMYQDRAALLRDRTTGPERPFALVVLGSSRTQCGFAPLSADLDVRLGAVVGRRAVAFNFGVPGAGPLVHHLYLDRLLAAGNRPDTLFLEVTPSMLLDDGSGPREWRAGAIDPARLRWAELCALDRSGAASGALRADWGGTRASALWKHRSQFVWRAVPAWADPQCPERRAAPQDASGWTPTAVPEPTAEVRRRALAGARAEHAAAAATGTVHPAPVASLRAACEACRREGIPLTLLLMPEGPSFRALYAPAVEARVRDLLRDLCAEYALPLTDARDWAAEEDFIDGHHLLPAGARRFTARLADEVILPDAARRHPAK